MTETKTERAGQTVTVRSGAPERAGQAGAIVHEECLRDGSCRFLVEFLDGQRAHVDADFAQVLA